ncbi:MAG: hypothetical protein H6909_03140 [Rickettsiaceae bacterium]|nr:hypothetical protein [Rickettsiaceae bacterium]
MDNIRNNIRNLIITIQNKISAIFCYLKMPWSNLYSHFPKLLSKLQNIADSNLKLGLFHLEEGNINDAILRFKLVNKYLSTGNKTASYWLGWCYIIKQKFHKAEECFHKNGEHPELVSLTSNIKNIPYISDSIYTIRRNIQPIDFIDKFSSEQYNLAQIMVKNFVKLAKLPNDYQILELESGPGWLSQELKLRLQGNFHFTSTESCTKLIEMQQYLYPDKKWPDLMVCSPVEEYILTENKRYNAIFSLDGFAHNSNLEEFFASIYDLITDYGYFAFAIRVSENTHLSKKLLEYSYKEAEIKTILYANEFTILYNEQFILENKNTYSIFICYK